MSVEGMTEIENHLLATIIMIIDLGIYRYGMLKLEGENFDEWKDMYIASKYLPKDKYSLQREKRVTL